MAKSADDFLDAPSADDFLDGPAVGGSVAPGRGVGVPPSLLPSGPTAGDYALAGMQGLGGTWHELGKNIAIVGGGVPVALDPVAKLFTGNDHSLSDPYFRNVVDPIAAQDGAFALPQNATFGEKASHALGGGLGTISQIVAAPISPELGAISAAETLAPTVAGITARAATKAVPAMTVPATSAAVTAGENASQHGGSMADIINSMGGAYLGNTAMGVLPASAGGNLLSRMGQAAVSMPAVGEVAREGQNLLLPESLQTRAPTPEELAIQAITSAPFGFMPHNAPEYAKPEAMAADRARYGNEQAQHVVDATVPERITSIADLIAQNTGLESQPKGKKELKQAAKESAFGPDEIGIQKDKVVYNRDTLDPNTGEMQPAKLDKTGSIATADSLDKLASNRERVAALEDDQVQHISDKTGLTADEIRGLSPAAQIRLFHKQTATDTSGVMLTSHSPGAEDGAQSPASKPNIPADRDGNTGIQEDVNARMQQSPEDAAAAVSPAERKVAMEKKARLMAQLDDARAQLDALNENTAAKQTQRKIDLGEPLTEAEQKAHNKWADIKAKASKRVYDLENAIYATEAKSEAGSKAASGNSDRPFKQDTSEHAAMFEDNARAKAAAEEEAAINKMEAEWRARSDMRKEAERQREAGRQRQQQDRQEQSDYRKAESFYGSRDGSRGNGTAEHAPMENGRHPVDDFGFVKSTNGNPIHFNHQRDAARWILSKGNKSGTDQVFEIENHPSGKGFTVHQRSINENKQAGQQNSVGGAVAVDPKSKLKTDGKVVTPGEQQPSRHPDKAGDNAPKVGPVETASSRTVDGKGYQHTVMRDPAGNSEGVLYHDGVEIGRFNGPSRDNVLRQLDNARFDHHQKRMAERNAESQQSQATGNEKYSGHEVSYEVDVNGEKHTITVDAAKALNEIDRRASALEALKKCLGA